MKRPQDDYALFRLYNAATPYETRFASGVTFDQWASSRQRTRWRSREFIYERDGQVKGSVRAIRRLRTGQLLVSVHPEDESNVGALIDYGLSQLRGMSTVYCLVPDYLQVLQRLLLERGYEAVSEYTTMVNTMAVPAKVEEARRAATIASI
jgi:hypothetical protein